MATTPLYILCTNINRVGSSLFSSYGEDQVLNDSLFTSVFSLKYMGVSCIIGIMLAGIYCWIVKKYFCLSLQIRENPLRSSRQMG